MDERSRFLLGQMIGLLGSDHDGEVLAANRQIKRILTSQGMSYNDLVDIVRNDSAPGRAPQPEGFGLKEMAQAILQNEDMLKDHERRFVTQVMVRAAARRDYQLTEKQAKWFSFLYAEYGAEL